jgi:hypothetical protein
VKVNLKINGIKYRISDYLIAYAGDGSGFGKIKFISER